MKNCLRSCWAWIEQSKGDSDESDDRQGWAEQDMAGRVPGNDRAV